MNFNAVSLYRLSTIRSLFRGEDVQLSILDLANLTGVPVDVIRNDIVMMHRNEEWNATFMVADEEEEDDDYFEENLKSGKLDAVALAVYLKEYSAENEDLWLPLTTLQKERLDAFYEEMLGKSAEQEKYVRRRYTVKAPYNQAEKPTIIKPDDVRKSIQNKETIRMRYNGRTYVILPLQILHNAMEDWYYVVTIVHSKLKFFRLDKITDWKVSKEKIEIADKSPLELVPKMWGPEPGKPFYVKIKVMDEADVRRKVKRDLAYRDFKEVWAGDDLYYEGEVIGRNNFKNWLRSYGSSVLVVEPSCLKSEMITSAKKKLKYYNE